MLSVSEDLRLISVMEKSKNKVLIQPSEISLLADDLAGACDIGIGFLNAVGSVMVGLDPDFSEPKRLNDNASLWR